MDLLNDTQYWHTQAEEMIALARRMKDPLTRQAMRRVASDYEVLARRAEERLAGVTHDHD